MFPRTDTWNNNALPLKFLEVLEINAVHSGCRNISTCDVHLWMKLGLCSFSESLMQQKFDGSSLKRNILSASSLAGLVLSADDQRAVTDALSWRPVEPAVELRCL